MEIASHQMCMMMNNMIIDFLHTLSRKNKQFLILLLDFLILAFSLFIAHALRFGELYLPTTFSEWGVWSLSPLIALPIFIRFGLYRAVIQYVEFRAIWTITKAVTFHSLIFSSIVLISDIAVPRSVFFINWLVAIVSIAGSRVFGRWMFRKNQNGEFFPGVLKKKVERNVVVYGAGTSGAQLVHSLSMSGEMNPVAFVDDRSSMVGLEVSGLKVYSSSRLEELVRKSNVNEVLLAMPSAPRSKIGEIVRGISALPVQIRTLPGVSELAQGKVEVSDIREVLIEDLLGRDKVEPDTELLHANIKDKVVMITGAGGSIGSELSRQIIKLNPKQVVLFELNEFSLYSIEKEFADEGLDCVSILGSVLELAHIQRVCLQYQVDTIYHAAAYKHVPLVEKNPTLGVVNNVIGTLNTAKAAINANVETFVLISTDKAVRPTNVMGASKRFAELVLQGLQILKSQGEHNTRFTMVRFGNVLGSSGSVVPYFRKLIKSGGPITVTHEDIIRYFMTIPEASQLVIQAGAMGEGGDVFVLDMGEPVKIMDLAKQMILLSGLELKDEDNPKGDIEIQVTGLRPGEKLYEELLIGDNVTETQHPRIMRAEEEVLEWDKLQGFIDELCVLRESNDSDRLREMLLEVVTGYNPLGNNIDLLHNSKPKH